MREYVEKFTQQIVEANHIVANVEIPKIKSFRNVISNTF